MRPLRAALRLATDPSNVIEPMPLPPGPVKLNKFVVPRVSVPSETLSVIASAELAWRAAASAILMALPPAGEKVTDPLLFTFVVLGAVIVGAPITVIATVADPERLSPKSPSEIQSESEPLKPELGW